MRLIMLNDLNELLNSELVLVFVRILIFQSDSFEIVNDRTVENY